MKTLKLKDGGEIPILGFGTWQLKGEECRRAVATALEVGYRHIDTAEVYENHSEVGKAIRQSRIKREELFVTSKVWRDDLRREDLAAACQRALEELKLDYLDLYLVHWPNRRIPIGETLEAMEKLKDKGLIKAIGVSNFTIAHLEEAAETGIGVANNQVEFHPTWNQKFLKEYCDKRGIVVTAYSPLGQGRDTKLTIVRQLANKYQKGACQVILNWLRAKDIVAIPRSANPEHIKDNFESLDWDLEPEDVEKLNKVGEQRRMLRPHFAEFED